MSSKRRLAKLESKQPSAAIPTNAPEMLVSLLAKRDALFWPTRKPGKNYPLIVRMQRKYLAGEQGLIAKAEGRADWKDAHNLRKELARLGLITAQGSSSQTKTVFLTPQGEAHARALCGGQAGGCEDLRFYPAWELRFKTKNTGKSFLWESTLFERAIVGQSSQFSWCIEAILPLLVCGAVECFPNTVCQLFYKWIGLPERPKVLVSEMPAKSEFNDMYMDSFNAETVRLDSLQGDDHELYIPMPATGWASDADKPWLEACGVEPEDPEFADPPEVRYKKRQLAEALKNDQE